MATDEELDVTKIEVEDENPINPPEGYTAEEWSDLSEEERQGILDSINEPEGEEAPEKELTEEEKTNLAAIAGDEADGDEKPSEKKPDEKKEEVAEVADEELLSFRPTVTEEELPKLVEPEEEIPAELQTKIDDLEKKFDDGEITKKEHDAQRDKVNREIVKHNNTLLDKAKQDRQAAKEAVVWKKEQRFFLDKKPEYDKFAKDLAPAEKKKRSQYYALVSDTVREITSDPKNAHLTGMQVLLMADKEVKEVFGVKAPVKPEKKEEKPAARIPDHKTLADIPQAQMNEGLDDSFAQIDKLRGDAYEEALEKMSPKAREAYLARV